MKIISKPLAGEYLPYAIDYIELVPDDGLVLKHLLDNLQTSKKLVEDLSEEKLTTPCAPGEWTIKEIFVHIIDTERVFAYRALCFARKDTTELPGYEQDDYASASEANQRSFDDILEEFTAVRMASIALIKSFSDEAMTRSGQANGHPLSVRAAIYQIVGHETFHIKSIKENYFS